MCDAVQKTEFMGRINMFGTQVLLVLKPDHVKQILTTTVEHALHGLKPASIAFFGKKVLFVLQDEEWYCFLN